MIEYAATQEPSFSITFVEAATQTEIIAALMEKDVVTQEPTPLKSLVEVSTQMEAVEPEVETIPYYNLEDLKETTEQSQDTKFIQE